MSMEPCLTFTVQQFEEISELFANFLLGFLLLAWMLGIRWIETFEYVEYRIRRYRRRRRLSTDPARTVVIPDNGEGRA